MRAKSLLLLLLVSVAANLTTVSAQNFPHVPDNLQILDINQVKNYWVNMTPEPREPNLLNRDRASLMVAYPRQVGERHRFIQAIRAGTHDRLARLVMLRHNIQTYLLKGNDEMVAKLRAELAELEAEIAAEEEVAAAARREQEEADRIERLIAATNRLAAALENNNGALPRDLVQEVHEIVPFEEDCDIVPNIHRDIIGHRLPIIIDHGHGHNVHVHGNNQHVRPNRVQQRRVDKLPQTTTPPRRSPAQGGHRTPSRVQPTQPRVSQPRTTQPSTKQPSVRQPSVRQPSVKTPSVPQQTVRQPSVRPAR